MKDLKVIRIGKEELVFDDGTSLVSAHDHDCCERHYLAFDDLSLNDFDGLTFDLTNDSFFRKIEEYGIQLISKQGNIVNVAGYGYNNGYYGTNIDLIIVDKDGNPIKCYDVSECQHIEIN